MGIITDGKKKVSVPDTQKVGYHTPLKEQAIVQKLLMYSSARTSRGLTDGALEIVGQSSCQGSETSTFRKRNL